MNRTYFLIIALHNWPNSLPYPGPDTYNGIIYQGEKNIYTVHIYLDTHSNIKSDFVYLGGDSTTRCIKLIVLGYPLLTPSLQLYLLIIHFYHIESVLPIEMIVSFKLAICFYLLTSVSWLATKPKLCNFTRYNKKKTISMFWFDPKQRWLINKASHF